MVRKVAEMVGVDGMHKVHDPSLIPESCVWFQARKALWLRLEKDRTSA